ncbi:kinase-like protein [Rhizoclosmatium globosum]|uniref:Kinase-like protein n=1 Tax=Rhizoclosmatium globosum TaxID=329046 RepID=A0A1Y2C4S3_9FUNG|nr:kinase-like protein [Rhizoclosmatium globosum]|eukprot:ORY42033.1 kinase-like protein [Rhizoclosmatium globosum]
MLHTTETSEPPLSTTPIDPKPKRIVELTSVQTITGIESDEEEEDVSPSRSDDHHPPKPKRVRLIFGTWILGKTIGTGSSGSVKLVIHKDIGKKCVVKSIKRQGESTDQSPVVRNKDGIALREHFMIREALVGVTLDHPNILKMHSYVVGKNHFYFFYEYLEGMDLADYITERGRMTENDARYVFKQIIAAVDYCHKSNVIHRDLKLENIRINPIDRKIHLLDFGFSTFYSPKFKQHSSCGSPCYASPEIYLHKPYRGPEVDVWSLGVCLYGMIVAALPFEKEDFDALTECVVGGDFIMPEYASWPLQFLLSQMLAVDPIHRISLVDVLNSPWVLNATLPTQNMTAASALPPLPTPAQRFKAIYRSSADVKFGSLLGIRSGKANDHGRRGLATASGASALLSSPSTYPENASLFAIDWVEDVLRMERHTRAEFLMRELERRAVHRKWSLEREWRTEGCVPPCFDVGDVIVDVGKKVDISVGGSRGALQALTKLAEALKVKGKVGEGNGEMQGTPMPVRSKTMMERVFRKPLGSPFATKTTGGSTTAGWGSSHILPVSLNSRWNIKSDSAANSDSTVQTEGQADNSTVARRLFRKWSTVPAFVVDEVRNPVVTSEPPTMPSGKSHLTLFDENENDLPPSEDNNANRATPKKFFEQLRMPESITNWWRRRFEQEGRLKSKRKSLDMKRRMDNVSKGGAEDGLDTEEGSDTESFECIQPVPRESIYDRIGRHFRKN